MGKFIINRKLSLLKKRIGDWSKLKNINKDLYGDASFLEGDASKITGDVTDVSGDVSNISGDVTAIYGNISKIKGDVSKISGRVSGSQKDYRVGKKKDKWYYQVFCDFNLVGDEERHCLSGDIGQIFGDVSGVWGDVTQLSGDLTGIKGDTYSLIRALVKKK